MLLHSPYSPDFVPSYFKKMLPAKQFRSNEEMIVKTKAYFANKDKSLPTCYGSIEMIVQDEDILAACECNFFIKFFLKQLNL